MPRKATNAGVDVAYEVIGVGTPLALLHMIFDAKESWSELGYAEQLLGSGRQLICIDASGHGESSKPHQPEPYQLRPRADEVAAVLDDLKIEKCEVLGYSMGGWTALGLVLPPPRSIGECCGRRSLTIRSRFAAAAHCRCARACRPGGVSRN